MKFKMKLLASFDTRQAEVAKVRNAAGRISSQMLKLDNQKNSIRNSSEQPASISQENAASSQEVSANMQTLSGIVRECNNDMALFVNICGTPDGQVSKFHAVDGSL